MSEPEVKRAKPADESVSVPLLQAVWERILPRLDPPDLAALRLSSRALCALSWALEPAEQPFPFAPQSRRLRVLVARAPHLSSLSLLLSPASAQADIDFFLTGVLGGRPLRDALPLLRSLSLIVAEDLPAESLPALVLAKLVCPEGMELRMVGLPPPAKVPPGLFRLSIRCASLTDAHFARTDMGRCKTLREVSVEPTQDGEGRPRAMPVGPLLLKALPPGLHSLRVMGCRLMPSSGPFPKELRELIVRGAQFSADSMLALKALKHLKRLSLDLCDGTCAEGPLRYPFPTFSMASFPDGLEALRLVCSSRRVLLAGVFPSRLRLLVLCGQMQLSPGMAVPPRLLRQPDSLVFRAADYQGPILDE